MWENRTISGIEESKALVLSCFFPAASTKVDGWRSTRTASYFSKQITFTTQKFVVALNTQNGSYPTTIQEWA